METLSVITDSELLNHMNDNLKTASILIIEDDKKLAQLTTEYLISHNFNIEHQSNGVDAVAQIKSNPPDLVILDLNLPGMDGLEVCRTIRPFYKAPILMLTARDEDVDQILGLEIGADDYITKPAAPRLLLARIHALLRRTLANEEKLESNLINKRIVIGELEIALESREVKWHQQMIDLTTNEFDLLVLFASNPGAILSRNIISQEIRGIEFDGLDRWVDIQVSRLRARFGDEKDSARKLKTVWGKGYLFVSEAWLS